MNCPSCNTKISAQNINIQTDLAQCHHCDLIFKVSEQMYKAQEWSGGDLQFDVNNPPKGCWINRDKNDPNTVIVGATTRSWLALFLVPFMIVWSGGSLGGIYGSQIIDGEFNIFMSLFGIPFLLGSIVFWSLALMSIAGKIELTLNKNGGKVFTGVWKIGFTKGFSWDDISTVREDRSYSQKGGTTFTICLEGKKRVSFGYGLSSERRYYLMKVIDQILMKKKSNRSIF
jgi:hypothetical protein